MLNSSFPFFIPIKKIIDRSRVPNARIDHLAAKTRSFLQQSLRILDFCIYNNYSQYKSMPLSQRVLSASWGNNRLERTCRDQRSIFPQQIGHLTRGQDIRVQFPLMLQLVLPMSWRTSRKCQSQARLRQSLVDRSAAGRPIERQVRRSIQKTAKSKMNGKDRSEVSNSIVWQSLSASAAKERLMSNQLGDISSFLAKPRVVTLYLHHHTTTIKFSPQFFFSASLLFFFSFFCSLFDLLFSGSSSSEEKEG